METVEHQGSPHDIDISALHGLRVLDLSPLLPGPYCSRLLADFGAEVIKIERPQGGDWARYAPPLRDGESLLFHALNRGKKSLSLNLKAPQGRAILLNLARSTDVLLESFRPGVMQRLGLGADVLEGANPALIHCSLTGYGSEGPYRHKAGHDLNFAGLSGLLDLTGGRGENPGHPGAPMADMMGGMWATIGILLALFARQRGKAMGRVETSLLGAALACLPVAMAEHWGGQHVTRGEGLLTGGVVCYHIYPCKDGGYMTLAALEPEFWSAFCMAAGVQHLIESQFSPSVEGEAAYDALCDLFRSRTRQEWAELLKEVDCCCEPVYSLGEALQLPAVQALRIVGQEGLLPPLRLSGREHFPPSAELAWARAPSLGEHNQAILGQLGIGPDELERLGEEGVI
jgi:alpha-methylacyl-CoA racemase